MNKEETKYDSPWDLASAMYPEIDKELKDEMQWWEIVELKQNDE